MKWSWQPLSHEERLAAIERYRQVVARRQAMSPREKVRARRPDQPVDTPGRVKGPKVLIMGEAFMVLYTQDIELATELMEEHLSHCGVDPQDVALTLSNPVALAPWIVEPHRARQLKGVLFRS